jgi:hypothetical protein
MFYAMRVVMVAGILLAASGCKRAETQVQKQPEVTTTEPTPGVPVSAPASTGPIPAKGVPTRVKARTSNGPISGSISQLFKHHGRLTGMPAC